MKIPAAAHSLRTTGCNSRASAIICAPLPHNFSSFVTSYRVVLMNWWKKKLFYSNPPSFILVANHLSCKRRGNPTLKHFQQQKMSLILAEFFKIVNYLFHSWPTGLGSCLEARPTPSLPPPILTQPALPRERPQSAHNLKAWQRLGAHRPIWESQYAKVGPHRGERCWKEIVTILGCFKRIVLLHLYVMINNHQWNKKLSVCWNWGC